MPSAKLITAPGAQRLLALAKGGATVYASYFAGSTNSRRGPWITPLEEIFGVRQQLRYGLIDPILEDVVTFELVEDLGELKPGETLSFKVGGSESARAFLPVEPTDAKVLAVDAAGRPALLRHSVGAGSTVLCTYPIEHMAAHRAFANPEDTWRLYSALASAAGVARPVRVPDPPRARRRHPRRIGRDRRLRQLLERRRRPRARDGGRSEAAATRGVVDARAVRRGHGGLRGLIRRPQRAGRGFMINTREQEEKEGGT